VDMLLLSMILKKVLTLLLNTLKKIQLFLKGEHLELKERKQRDLIKVMEKELIVKVLKEMREEVKVLVDLNNAIIALIMPTIMPTIMLIIMLTIMLTIVLIIMLTIVLTIMPIIVLIIPVLIILLIINKLVIILKRTKMPRIINNNALKEIIVKLNHKTKLVLLTNVPHHQLIK